MYSAFKSFLDKLEKEGAEKISLDTQDLRVILGVLFYTVITVDGRIRPQETRLYDTLLDEYLEVSEDERDAFEAEVAKQLNDTDSVEALTALLAEIPNEKKREIIAFMREISISDNELHEVELNLVSKASALLGLDDEN